MVASPDSADGSVRIHQDARVYAGLFDGAETAALELGAGRSAYVHVARGTVEINGVALETGDSVGISGLARIELARGAGAEVLVFDLT